LINLNSCLFLKPTAELYFFSLV